MKTPKQPKPQPVEKVTPLPDLSGAAVQQSRFDALKQALARRGRSSTILTYGNKGRSRGSLALSGRLSDIDGGRSGAEVTRA